MREKQYKEESARALDSESVEWDKASEVGRRWEQVKRVLVDSVRKD